jgi:pimeloyl-ACP methyl ester carboxylesterase
MISACHQEQMVFHPDKLPKDFKYEFNNQYQELFIEVEDQTIINGLLFKSKNSKGLIFYLHGNAGALNTWGSIADLYLKNGYDFFIMDYRSFGKSTGNINKEKDMYKDVQTVYDSLQHQYGYKNDKTIIIGYSIGTGFAAKLAMDNSPHLLILKAPYYSIPNLVNQHYKIVPHFLIKFKLPTYKYLKQVDAPIVVFHGDKDNVIPIKSSYKLQKYFHSKDTLVVMSNQNHQNIAENSQYIDMIAKCLDY